jgi:hypothetical protein
MSQERKGDEIYSHVTMGVMMDLNKQRGDRLEVRYSLSLVFPADINRAPSARRRTYEPSPLSSCSMVNLVWGRWCCWVVTTLEQPSSGYVLSIKTKTG